MTRIVLIVLLAFVFGCKSGTSEYLVNENRDSFMKKYFHALDSLPHIDSLNLQFKLLKAYFNNDTSFLKKSYNELEDILKYRNQILESRICEELPQINTLKYDQVYRFNYEAAFCDQTVIITIGNKTDTVTLDAYIYEYNYTKTRCKTISHTTEIISQKYWDELVSGINYVDFWGLKEDNNRRGMDGSSLLVSGYENPKNAFEGRFKIVYRWAAEKSALGILFKKVLEISKIKIDCFHYY